MISNQSKFIDIYSKWYSIPSFFHFFNPDFGKKTYSGSGLSFFYLFLISFPSIFMEEHFPQSLFAQSPRGKMGKQRIFLKLEEKFDAN